MQCIIRTTMDRRRFLKVLGLGGAAAVVTTQLVLPERALALPDPQRTFFLPPEQGWKPATTAEPYTFYLDEPAYRAGLTSGFYRPIMLSVPFDSWALWTSSDGKPAISQNERGVRITRLDSKGYRIPGGGSTRLLSGGDLLMCEPVHPKAAGMTLRLVPA